MSEFNIGDVAYRATAGQKQIWTTCPECLGSGRLRVILGDDSEVSIDCVCCERGYEGSPGKIQCYEFMAETKAVKISGIESKMVDGELFVRYSSEYWSIDACDLFATPEEAAARAAILVMEHEAEQTKRLKYKEKQTKTWAWNVSYWKRQIRDAQETIDRAKARLAVAPKNVKEADQREIGAKP